MARYDENGRPIKNSNSFLKKNSKDKRKKYQEEINSKKDTYETEIKEIDSKIEENNNENQNQETDISKFPVWSIYPIMFFTGFFGLIIGFVIYQSLKEKNTIGKERFMKHIKIAMILYIVFILILFVFPFLLALFLGNGTFSYSSN